MELTIGAVTVTVAGLMLGNELAVAVVHSTLWRLPAAVHVAVAAALAKIYGSIMPCWYAATLFTTLAVATVFPWGTGSWSILGAAVVWAATIALAIVVLAPINHRVALWAADAVPSDWLAQRRRWDRFHALRIVLALGGWLALVVGVLLACRGN
jgi:hypothetical protein